MSPLSAKQCTCCTPSRSRRRGPRKRIWTWPNNDRERSGTLTGGSENYDAGWDATETTFTDAENIHIRAALVSIDSFVNMLAAADLRVGMKVT